MILIFISRIKTIFRRAGIGPGLFIFAVILSGCEIMPGQQQPLAETEIAANQLARASSKRQLLVTFSEKKRANNFTAGSKRFYHGGGQWSASLHLHQRISAVANDFALTERDAWPIDSLNLYCVVFEAPPDENMDQLLAALNADARVSAAQPMNEFHGMIITSYDDPLFEMQYGQYKQTVEQLHKFTRGENVRIGILDSPVDTEHPDLKGQIDTAYQYVKAPGLDDQIHGTAVTGVIAAVADNSEGMVGLAPKARLFAYGACASVKRVTRCTSFSLAKAIEQAIEDRVNILNISLAGPQDPLLAALIGEAQRRSIIVIAAQNAANPQLNFPASMADVHRVGSGQSLTNWFARNQQLSTQAGGGYQFFYGTSVATAGVTGIAALLRSRWSTAVTNQLLTQLIQKNCVYPLEPVNTGFVKILQSNDCMGFYEKLD